MKLTEARAKELGMVKDKDENWVASVSTEEIVEAKRRVTDTDVTAHLRSRPRLSTPTIAEQRTRPRTGLPRRTPEETKRALIESFMAMGLDERTATLAARRQRF